MSLLLLLAAPTALAAEDGPKPYLYTQIWATAYDQDVDTQADPTGYGDPEDDMGFKLRRMRFGLEGTHTDWFYGVILGFGAPYDGVVEGGGDLAVLDAFAGWNATDWLSLAAGQGRTPSSRDAMTSSSRNVFTEGTLGGAHIAPGRDVGLSARVEASGVRFSAGAYNGSGAHEDPLLGDQDPGLLYAGRLEYALGGDDAYADVFNTWGAVDRFTLGVGGFGGLNNQLATDTLHYGGDLIVRVAGLAVLAEVEMNSITPTDSTVDAPGVLAKTNQMGLSAQAGYSVGAFEPAVRFEMFDDDTAAEQPNYGDVKQITVGFTAHQVEDRVRLGAGYVLRLEDAALAIPNDTARLWFQFKL